VINNKIGIPPIKPIIAGNNSINIGIIPKIPGGAIKIKYTAVNNPILIKSFTSMLDFSIYKSLQSLI
jgi:hypothetical protein